MSENSQSTDWAALAVEAMEQQSEQESARAAVESAAASPRLTPKAILCLAAKLLFLISVGYCLVDRYGIGHLIWLALVGWYLVWPTITPIHRNVFK